MSESERSLDSICSGTVYHVSEFWIQQGFEDVPTAVDCLWVGTRNHQSMVNSLLLPSFTFQPYHYPFPILLLKGSTENNKKKQKEPQCSYLGIGLNIDCVRVCVCYSCLTLCDPMDCSPPGSSFYGILQAWILEWVAMPFSRGSSPLRDWTYVSCIAGGFLTIWATREVQNFTHFTSNCGDMAISKLKIQVRQ